MLNEPSGFRSQPSNAGTTSWPEAKRVCARVGVLTAKRTNASASRSQSHRFMGTGRSKGRRMKAKRRLLLLILTRAIGLQAIALGDLRFELLVGHVVVSEPVARHVVGGAVAEAHPIAWIGVVPVAGGIVVPADHVHDRPRWQQRRDVVGVVVD